METPIQSTAHGGNRYRRGFAFATQCGDRQRDVARQKQGHATKSGTGSRRHLGMRARNNTQASNNNVCSRMNCGLDLLGVSLSAFDRYCRKKILRGSSSNIDSRRASNAQDRFKNPACAILLLRVVRVAPTFSTASTQSGLCVRLHFAFTRRPLHPVIHWAQVRCGGLIIRPGTFGRVAMACDAITTYVNRRAARSTASVVPDPWC